MKRVGHGQTRDATTVETVGNRLRSLAVGAGVASAAPSFGYMFPELQQDEANVLKPERATVEALRALGAAMTDVPEVAPVGARKALATALFQLSTPTSANSWIMILPSMRPRPVCRRSRP